MQAAQPVTPWTGGGGGRGDEVGLEMTALGRVGGVYNKDLKKLVSPFSYPFD